ncbi:MAG: 3,4-dihydroxy-2-butanone-4-phosphate synthase [Deltaproteobacteria bacterium]|nr:3,4-dihydroxy-2-butanone-4-phosphate synthase [Deltaproteobacteria bacterium]
MENQAQLVGASASQLLEAIEHFRKRRLIILIDSVAAKPRAVLVAPAEQITADTVNEMLMLGSGSLFVAISPERSAALLLSPMQRPSSHVTQAIEKQESAKVCISVEAREGVTTGISAADRACTIRVLGAKSVNPRKLVRPGHIFPVETREGGVLIRHALPEGALDLVEMAGYTDAAAYLEILNRSGEPSSVKEVEELAQRHNLPFVTLFDLTRFRLEREKIIERVAEAKLPTKLAGELRSIIYRSKMHSGEHLALIKGEITPDEPILTRVQAEFTFGDVFGGENPPTRQQLHRSLKAIGDQGRGVLIYLRRPFRGQLRQQISDWHSKFSEKPATMMREYGVGAQILQDLGIRRIELLTNTRRGPLGIQSFGIEIVGSRPLFE